MKQYYFEVVFKSGQVEGVWAGDFNSALIIASARQIEKGNIWQFISSIKKVENDVIILNPKISFSA